jgi:hypothetical protein
MSKYLGVGALVAYIATIFGANYAIEHVGFVTVAPGLMAPAGVYFVGLALVLRDAANTCVHRRAR